MYYRASCTKFCNLTTCACSTTDANLSYPWCYRFGDFFGTHIFICVTNTLLTLARLRLRAVSTNVCCNLTDQLLITTSDNDFSLAGTFPRVYPLAIRAQLGVKAPVLDQPHLPF